MWLATSYECLPFGALATGVLRRLIFVQRFKLKSLDKGQNVGRRVTWIRTLTFLGAGVVLVHPG